jgi:hypothetical protein
MDEIVANTPSHSFHQPIKKRTGFFTILGKIFLFLLLAVGLLLGGFYLGEQATPPATPTPTPTQTAMTPPTQTLPTPTPASQNTKLVKAGLGGDEVIFEPYTIEVPSGWTDARETTVAAGIDKLTLTKNGYSVTIYQAPMGGGGCTYKGDKPNEMAQLYTDYVDINGQSGQYRRSWTQNAGKSVTYTICQKADDASYGIMTLFGIINVVSPNPADTLMLTEVDGMIASMVKQ